MSAHPHIWKDEELTEKFLKGIRLGIPFAQEQIGIMLRVIDGSMKNPKDLLDLGCGDGTLAAAVLAQYPRLQAIWVDHSPSMLAEARWKLDTFGHRVEYVDADFSWKEWLDKLPYQGPFDLAISGFAIHHLKDSQKKRLYRKIFGILKKGGVFLDLEHVASASRFIEQIWDEYLIDNLYYFHIVFSRVLS